MKSFLKIEIEAVALILIALIVGVLFAFFKNKTTHQIPAKVSTPVVQTAQSSFPNYSDSQQVSPDGTKKLTMSVIRNKNLTKTYTFTSANIDGSDRQTAYALTLGKDTMSIPYNAWSPDNKYFFVLRKSSSSVEAIVAGADGNPLGANLTAINLTDLFTSRNTGNSYAETTGWAADTLVIVNSKTSNGDKGPSYWVEVPGGALIPLATQF